MKTSVGGQLSGVGFGETASNVKGIYRRKFPVVQSAAFDKRSPRSLESLQIVRIVEPEGGVSDDADSRLSRGARMPFFLPSVRLIEIDGRGAPGNLPHSFHIDVPTHDTGRLVHCPFSPRVFARRNESHMPLGKDPLLYPGELPQHRNSATVLDGGTDDGSMTPPSDPIQDDAPDVNPGIEVLTAEDHGGYGACGHTAVHYQYDRRL